MYRYIIRIDEKLLEIEKKTIFLDKKNMMKIFQFSYAEKWWQTNIFL